MGDLKDFLGKIEWEGGVDEALDYGLKTDGYDLPDHVKKAWDALVELHGEHEKKRRAHFDVIQRLLDGEGEEAE